ncbi:hypothetical protein [Nocardia sp. CA-119907]|uniref:hypothetical protein n=1 Tax=Nocardia sp. CA-119907 TaxID=3239973 RepID=UPI003D962CF7
MMTTFTGHGRRLAVRLFAAAGLATALAFCAEPSAGAAAQPFLFNYEFDHHLKVAGGNFTVGGQVYLTLNFNNDARYFSTKVTAQTHPITPGGAIYVETPSAAPCGGGGNNGYAQAYDYTTRTWSPRLPIEICTRID